MHDVDVFPPAQVTRSYCARTAPFGGLTCGPTSTPTTLGGTGRSRPQHGHAWTLDDFPNSHTISIKRISGPLSLCRFAVAEIDTIVNTRRGLVDLLG